MRLAKYKKNELQNLQHLKESGQGLVMFKFKLDYVEEQLFVMFLWILIKVGLLW